MATVQHPMFENTKRVVDDPEPWVEQGWREVPDEDPLDAVYTRPSDSDAPAETPAPDPTEAPKSDTGDTPKADPEPEMKTSRPKPSAPDKK
jgi:hypothetical protein